ncbi:MAG: hypothetical protein IKM96_07655 [Clostridiales bacterium]|nr:hypothetical protein [Clostridiales bacterium]MBQ5519448.1 hypothetical protein [Clostridiales bacterium]MBR3701609.1 hypothetical protein [Clostridiales bacterium]
MKKYVLETMNAVQKYIDEEMKNAPAEKTKEMLSEFETKISYFQHERLIHLMVTLAFATWLLFEIYCLFVLPSEFLIAGILLVLIFFGLTVGYVMHYYFLENSVQKMYHMRDEIRGFLNSSKII